VSSCGCLAGNAAAEAAADGRLISTCSLISSSSLLPISSSTYGVQYAHPFKSRMPIRLTMVVGNIKRRKILTPLV